MRVVIGQLLTENQLVHPPFFEKRDHRVTVHGTRPDQTKLMLLIFPWIRMACQNIQKWWQMANMFSLLRIILRMRHLDHKDTGALMLSIKQRLTVAILPPFDCHFGVQDCNGYVQAVNTDFGVSFFTRFSSQNKIPSISGNNTKFAFRITGQPEHFINTAQISIA